MSGNQIEVIASYTSSYLNRYHDFQINPNWTGLLIYLCLARLGISFITQRINIKFDMVIVFDKFFLKID